MSKDESKEPSSAVSSGLNDRPKNETIAQSGIGIPDDSGQPIDIDEAEAKRIEEKLVGKNGRT